MKINELGRHALIVALAQRAEIGRTAVMKMMFFLQEIRNVPLQYSFRIYTYGPYDAQVLEDLRLTEFQGGVTCERKEWAGGSGVDIKPGENASKLIESKKNLVEQFSRDIDWVVENFGRRSAADLEVLSTIVFVDKSIENCVNLEAFAAKVHALKPHHTLSKINREIQSLRGIDQLKSIC